MTGASRGIGRAVAEALAAEGAAVAVNYRSGKEQAEEVVAAIEAAGGKAAAMPRRRVRVRRRPRRWSKQTVEELGGLHILVNNAGIAKDDLIYNMDPADVARRDEGQLRRHLQLHQGGARRSSCASATA